jgi:hypothetical protein
MELQRALAEVAAIREQATRSEVYRGYRSIPVALSGVIGLAGAWLQPASTSADPIAFVIYWISIALAAGGVGISEIGANYLMHDDALARARTRRVVGQMLPGLLAGAAITVCFVRLSPTQVPLLPGIWAICFGVGIFASRPFLVEASGWAALYYYTAGIVLLWTARGPDTLGPWSVGGIFGVGQLLTAALLYRNLETPAPPGRSGRR